MINLRDTKLILGVNKTGAIAICHHIRGPSAMFCKCHRRFCLFIFLKKKTTVQRVKYIDFEGVVNILSVPLGTSEEQSSTCIGKV